MSLAGESLADAGLAHGGWVLQRLDEAPIDPSNTPTQATLRDGEVLYLRPRRSQLPELAFDDVADVVATGVNDKLDRWRQEHSRRFALGVAATAPLAAAGVILLAGPSWILPAIAASVITIVLLVAGIALSRAGGDSTAGAVLGYAALPSAFLAGALAPAGGAALSALGAPHLLAGFAAMVLVAVIAAVGVSDGLPVFLAVAIAAVIGTTCTAIGFVSDAVAVDGVAAVSVAVALALTPLIPTVAFRMARVTLPPVPTSAEDLRRDTLMVDGKQLLRSTAAADRHVTGMAVAISLVGLVAEIPLAFFSDGVGSTMCGVVGLALLLRSRVFRGRTQRLWFLVAGVAGLLMYAIGIAAASEQAFILAGVLLPLLVVAGIMVGVGLWLPGHRPTPFWGRAADIIDMLVVISLVPLALGVIGIYSFIRGLGG